MQDRKPMNLKSFLVVYNAAMVILSAYMFIQVRHNQTSCEKNAYKKLLNKKKIIFLSSILRLAGEAGSTTIVFSASQLIFPKATRLDS